MIRQILGEVSVPVANTDVQQVIENPGIVKTYLEKYMPSLISFLVQLVVAIVILLIGIKVIKSIVKIIKKGFDRSRMDAAVASFLANLAAFCGSVVRGLTSATLTANGCENPSAWNARWRKISTTGLNVKRLSSGCIRNLNAVWQR